MTIINSSIDSLKFIYNNIISIIEEKSINEEATLRAIIKDSYELLRIDKNVLDDLYFSIDNLVSFLKNKENNDLINSYLLSLIALKNDMKLQQNLNIEQVNLYLEEVKYIISLKSYLNNNETFLKVLECLAKIQYAYNLLNEKISILDLYNKTIINANKENLYYKRLIDLQDNNININYNDMGLTYLYYMMFYNKYPHIIYKMAIKMILTFWKANKFEYYALTEEEIEKELNENKYNFIYL